MRDLGFDHDSSLVGGLTDRIAWQTEARCADIADPDRFFPDRGGSMAAPRAVCSKCSVREACLQYAIDEEIEFGVWGGMSTPQRRRYAVQLQAQQEPEKSLVFVDPQKVEKMLKLVRIKYVPRQRIAA